jgi:hypothetical protein
MGGRTTAMVGLAHSETFAAIAVMGATGYNDEKSAAYSAQKVAGLPFIMIIGTADGLNVQEDANGNKCIGISGAFKGGLDRLMSFNGVSTVNRDCSIYPYWGYPSVWANNFQARNLRYDISYLRKEGAKAPIAELVLFETAGHAHSDQYATLAWDFFSQFKR